MVQMARKTLADDMKALMDLVSRTPAPVRVTMHMERLLAAWREALDPDAYGERLDSLRTELADGIEQMFLVPGRTSTPSSAGAAANVSARGLVAESG